MMYDWIVVGGGTAGCVLAYRLSEDPRRRVLLIEAGPASPTPLARIPKGAGKVLTDPGYAWHYPVAEAGAETWTRGRLLGGTSAVNGMIYVRGSRADFDAWERLGNPGWGWRDMAPAFAAVDRMHAACGEPAPSPSRTHSPLCAAFIEAAVARGARHRQFLDDSDAPGVGFWRWSIGRGRRVSAADAFLRPARRRPNLELVADAAVERILFEGRRAVGVSFRRHGAVQRVHGNETVLCAGAIQSPILLMLSGVGPGQRLAANGIEVVHHSAEVGANLREHRAVLLQFRLRVPDSLNLALRGWRLAPNVLRYALARTGPLAEGFWDAGAFLRAAPGDGPPDFQIVLGRFVGDLKTKKLAEFPGAQCIAYPLRPESRGAVLLRSADPRDPPEIRPNYLGAEADRATSLRSFRLVRDMFGSPPLADLIAAEVTPGPGVQTDDEVLAAYAERGVSALHATGTCRMGNDDGAVVDAQLRVRGVAGLRVVDASVMPTMPSANTSKTVMALAWRAADAILAGAPDGQV